MALHQRYINFYGIGSKNSRKTGVATLISIIDFYKNEN